MDNAQQRANEYLLQHATPESAFEACLKDVIAESKADFEEIRSDAKRLLDNAGGDYETAINYLCFYMWR